VLRELINRLTEHLQDKTKLQVSLENYKNDKVSQTKLLSKQEFVNKLADWVNFFIDYQDMEIEDITCKPMAIEIPTGVGRVNSIITTDSKRSIIHVKNTDQL